MGTTRKVSDFRNWRAVAIGVLVLIMAGLVGAPSRVLGATTFVVNKIGDAADLNIANAVCDVSTNSGNQCTLRAAIQEANDTPGADTINFNITSTSKVIAPNSPLPPITGPVTINGYSQANTSVNTQVTGNNAVLKVVLDGVNAGVDASGLEIQGGSSVIQGLIIQRFDGTGLAVSGDRVVVKGNFIGTNGAGTAARANGTGVSVFGRENAIGGPVPGARNVISGNQFHGVSIFGPAAIGNFIQGNYIGTTKGGGGALGNGVDGVNIDSAPGNVVGGTGGGSRNVISGNGFAGITIVGGSAAGGTIVTNNYIGTDATGTADLGNGQFGVDLTAEHVAIGGEVAEKRNVISGNDTAGMRIQGSSNTIEGNYIGTNAAGNLALGNTGNGISMIASSNVIGGLTVGRRNVISGNGGDGIFIAHGNANTVLGNRIGTKADGSGDLGNQLSGIMLSGADNTTIGGAASGAPNTIAGNDSYGIRIFGEATGTLIQANTVAGNADDGIRIHRGAHRIVGNSIVANGDAGIVVQSTASGVRISGNQMAQNGELGIDLEGGTENGFGVTANDNDDPDMGANALQNFSVLTSAVRNNQTGVTTIAGTLNSTPGVEFRIELFIAVADPSGNGEGYIAVAAANITTNAGGDKGFTLQSVVPMAGMVLTATATRVSTGSTSEFSANRAVEAGQ